MQRIFFVSIAQGSHNVQSMRILPGISMTAACAVRSCRDARAFLSRTHSTFAGLEPTSSW